MSQLKDWEVLAAMVGKDKAFKSMPVVDGDGDLLVEGEDYVVAPEGFELCPHCPYPACLFGEDC